LTRWEQAAEAIRGAMRTRVVGLDDVVDKLLLCILTRNHALLVGVPGLAKTLLVTSLAELLDLSFSRVQFTPDLMPGDITGAEVLSAEGGERTFRFLPGPIFANIVLADEINRTPPKTQAALMEAMEERQVTSLGRRYPLPDPFFVLATQNPIEHEGTYELPAAQLDRFMFRIRVEYPALSTETTIARRLARAEGERLKPVLGPREIGEFHAEASRTEIPADLEQRIVRFVRATRPSDETAPGFVRDWLSFGAGPRAATALAVGSRARALLHGRAQVREEDVVALAPDVVRHRLLLNHRAVAEGIRAVDVVRRLLALHFASAAEPARDAPRGLLARLFGR
jgi:MoxR-like ATPase